MIGKQKISQTMKKLSLLVFILFLIPLKGYSQKCKFLKNETDKFTKQLNLISEPVEINKKISSPEFFSFIASYSGIDNNKHVNILFLQFHSRSNNFNSLYTSKGDELYIMLNDGSVIKYEAIKDSETKFKEISNTTWSMVTNSYYIDDEQLKEITSVGVSEIRMNTDEKYYETKINDKENQKINKYITCYLNALPQVK